MVIVALYFRGLRLYVLQVLNDRNTLIVQSILQSMIKKNQGIHFHHHRQAYLIHYFGLKQTPLLAHVTQCRIRVRPGYVINQVRPT